MKLKATMAGLTAAAMLASVVGGSIPASAQSSHRQQQNKNNWRNIGIGAGAVGLYGLLKHDNTLAILGTAGGLYSLNRYEQDRKSQSRADHDRAALYSRSSFTRNGHRYVRRTVTKNGHKYYQFVRK